MVPITLRDVIRLLAAIVLSAILYRMYLTAPVLDHLSLTQWRGVAIAVGALLGIMSAVAQWNLSTLFAGVITGLLAGATWVATPTFHGRIADAFESSLVEYRAEVITLTIAAVGSAFCVSCLLKLWDRQTPDRAIRF